MLLKRDLNAKILGEFALILKTISHPIRLEIISILETMEPISVSKINNELKIPIEQSLLSHHLVKMKDRGIISSEKNGKYIYYSIGNRDVLKIFDCMEKCKMV